MIATADINVPIWAFLSLVISAIGVPLITSWIRSREKKQDWKRQDEVARRQELAAKKVTETADLLVQSNATVAKAAEVTSGKVAEIYHMVDGQMTITMQESLESKKASLVLMREMVADKKQRKIQPLVETLATIGSLEERIVELTTTIAERQALVAAAASSSRLPDNEQV